MIILKNLKKIVRKIGLPSKITHPRCMANDGPSADEPVVRHVVLKAASYAQNSDDPKKV